MGTGLQVCQLETTTAVDVNPAVPIVGNIP